MSDYVLGISCFYHDSSAVLIHDGNIIVAVQEERFTRKKHDNRFPKNAIKYCLYSQNIDLKDIKTIVYYEKPLLTFERLLETYIGSAPRGLRSFISAMRVWSKEKLFLKANIKNELKLLQKKSYSTKKFNLPKLLFSEHHLSHAAAAFFPSPFEKAAILCMDGVGEWSTTSAWVGEKNKLRELWNISFPHSIGLLYSSFTYYCGFKVNSGEYKLMGLAPYGKPLYLNLIKDNLIDIKEDGTFRLNMSFFKFHRGFRMTSSKFHKLFGALPREPESKLTQFHMDIAASIQQLIEEIVVKLAKSLQKETGLKNICLAGGVALNCVANGKLLKKKIYKGIWVQPASGDAGSALGAALAVWYLKFNKTRHVNKNDSMKGSFLGCNYTNKEIIDYLDNINVTYKTFEDKNLFEFVANKINEGKVIGWFNGPMEFGPRALGGRSIIGDPRNKNMQKIMNLKIKYRESFRPFAPAILEEDASTIFDLKVKSPYMLFVAQIRKNLWKVISKNQKKLSGIDQLEIIRTSLPAITHVDYSSRVQTVSKSDNFRFYELISTFKKITNCPVIINTSFNVRGEPIVMTPKDAYICFMRTDMDILVLQNQILLKENQREFREAVKWQEKYELD